MTVEVLLKNMGIYTQERAMTVNQVLEATNLAQNVHVLLTNAITDAAAGNDYSDNWEKAMQNQTELLRAINTIKYRATNRPRATPVA